ncbi:Sphingosine N-acyltransferase lag1 [Coemansia sp. RSA 2399]|nr:Sphingosine N-acyltransferase lag1 [Coemansia sp. RSA 2399]KAJ1895582.1 Sphingosine N-acyltransferase lag1 [Coemansia sp. IMI 209127]
MLLLKKRQPSSTLADVEHSPGSSSSDTANEIADLQEASASAKEPTRVLRSRQKGLSPVENHKEYEALDGDAKTRRRSSAGIGRKKPGKRIDEKKVILNTRNPAIIWLANNELHASLLILAVVYGSNWAGYEWPQLWIQMQHKALTANPYNVRYVRGIHDIKFVAFWIAQIIAARALCLRYVMPAVGSLLSLKGSRETRRFSEMAWMLLYITASWTIGFRVWQNSPYYMTTATLFANYPDDHVLMPYGLKWYYLVQSAFWLSNVYTIHVEERRKDYYEMMTHHVVTISLVLSSYYFHFTRFGHAFMLVMDLPDIFLSSAKMIRYMGMEFLPNILFGMFAVSWVVTKHYLCLKMMYATWKQGFDIVPPERRYPHYPNSYMSVPVASFFWILLCMLQIVLIYWFVLIVKIIQRMFVKGECADDNRSDDEDEGSSVSPEAMADQKTFTAENSVSSRSSSTTLAARSPSTS